MYIQLINLREMHYFVKLKIAYRSPKNTIFIAIVISMFHLAFD
jgi:hypothetical protein